ncbi:MAG: hypothetical protein WD749_00435 [Phycisphaerales bacterium]
MKSMPRPAAPGLKKAAREAVGHLKSRLPLPGRPGGDPSPAELAAARVEVNGLLGRVKQSRMGGRREVALLEECLVERIARGGSFEDFAADLRRRAEAEVARHRALIDRLAGLAGALRPPGVRQRLRHEVIMPAGAGRLTGQEAWDAADAVMGRRVLREAEPAAPAWSLVLGVSAEAGAVLGVEGSRGLSGARHRNVCVVDSLTVAVGLYAGVAAAAKVSASPCAPQDLDGFAVCCGLGGTLYVGLGVGAGFVPMGIIKDPMGLPMIDWRFDGVSVAVSGGGEIQVSIGFEYSIVTNLRGQVA